MIQILGCAACYGDPNSPLSKGALWGVALLLVVIVGVLGGFGSLFVYWMRRARALERQLALQSAAAAGDEPSVEEAPVWRTESEAGTPSSPSSVH